MARKRTHKRLRFIRQSQFVEDSPTARYDAPRGTWTKCAGSEDLGHVSPLFPPLLPRRPPTRFRID